MRLRFPDRNGAASVGSDCREDERRSRRARALAAWRHDAECILCGVVYAALSLVIQACPGGSPDKRVPVRPSVAAQAAAASHRDHLRVCADPNNLPFSNSAEEGFENRIAHVIAADLGADVEYTWWAQRRGFIRNTLKAGLCDIVIGVPSALDMVLTTAPYYRSIYVFVSRADRALDLRSFDDPRLHDLRIGVQMIGDDGNNTPPAHALSNRHVIANVVGYTVYGNYAEPNPAARIVDAVSAGDVDVAVVWGPLAGYFAKKAAQPLALSPVTPEIDRPFLPFAYDISVGVRRGEQPFKEQIDGILTRERTTIEAILDEYGVPRAPSSVRAGGNVHADAGGAHAVTPAAAGAGPGCSIAGGGAASGCSGGGA